MHWIGEETETQRVWVIYPGLTASEWWKLSGSPVSPVPVLSVAPLGKTCMSRWAAILMMKAMEFLDIRAGTEPRYS